MSSMSSVNKTKDKSYLTKPISEIRKKQSGSTSQDKTIYPH